MWKNILEWFGALLITASMAVSMLGLAEWVENRRAVIPAAAEKGAYTVVVDAGHGGADGGAVGTGTGVSEAGLNLAVAKRVEALLTARGIAVTMTRTSEEALAEDKNADMQRRKQILNGDTVDIIVSIHMNAFPDKSISGAMAYYMAGSKEGQRLAQQVIDCVCDAAGKNRRLANPGDYFVLRECASPAVLVECGFLSNPEEEKLLQEPAQQALLAKAIADGVCTYLGVA